MLNKDQEEVNENRNAPSHLSQNRNASIISESKLTQQYSQMWENEEDRQRVMARFRSFDMTGLSQYNSYNQRSPSQLTINQSEGGNMEANQPGSMRNMVGMNAGDSK